MVPVDPDRPVIVIDPARRFGRPSIKGISTEAVAGMVMGGESINVTADEYGLTRHEVILACWHEGLQGVYRREWNVWANEVHRPLGGWEPLDVDAISDPPCRDELGAPTAVAGGR